MSSSTNSTLQHFGKKGMKWGVHNEKVESAKTTTSTEQKEKTTAAPDRPPLTEIKKKGLSSTQKKVLIGGALLTGAVATTIVLQRTGNLNVNRIDVDKAIEFGVNNRDRLSGAVNAAKTIKNQAPNVKKAIEIQRQVSEYRRLAEEDQKSNEKLVANTNKIIDSALGSSPSRVLNTTPSSSVQSVLSDFGDVRVDAINAAPKYKPGNNPLDLSV